MNTDPDDTFRRCEDILDRMEVNCRPKPSPRHPSSPRPKDEAAESMAGCFLVGGALGCELSLIAAPFFLGFWGCLLFVPGVTLVAGVVGMVVGFFAVVMTEGKKP